jgi:hypothetical protein
MHHKWTLSSQRKRKEWVNYLCRHRENPLKEETVRLLWLGYENTDQLYLPCSSQGQFNVEVQVEVVG